jgi:uncharacterized repeat protein (TIGR01451 family)
MSSKGLFRRLSRVAVVVATSSVVLASGAGMSAAYATSDHSQGNAGTSGTYSQPQPLSTADQNTGGANGQCPTGPYCSTRDGSPSLNGNGGGQATGKPCAGCVGKADNKNPQGQMPNGSDNNAGYECDRNNGIGKTNPAHTGCKPALVGTCVTAATGGVSWLLTNGNAFDLTASWTSGADSGTVTVPAGGSATFTTTGSSVNVTFPGTTFAAISGTMSCPPPPPVTQTVAAVINVCSTNMTAPSEGAQLAVESTSITGGNVIAPTDVAAGAYTVDATAPTGYHFLACSDRTKGAAQNIATATSATEGVTVPSGGSDVAYFYVEKDTSPSVPVQHLAGVIYICSTGAQAPAAGSDLAIEGSAIHSANPLAAQSVEPGQHTVDATAPTGYHFVACGGSTQTIVSATSATENVVVPANEDRTATFYVEKNPPTPTQTLAGVINVCATGLQVSGGTLSATGEGQTFTGVANPMAPVEVPAGDYTMTAAAPAGFHLVVCDGLGSTGAETVGVPVGGAGVGVFYVAPDETGEGGDQTLAGVIYLCSSGQVVSGGTLSATGTAATFTGQANPFGPVSVPAGDYAMSAAAPAGFHLVVCNGHGSTGTETVTVPEGGSGLGRFYVAPDVTVTQTLAGVIYLCSSGQMVSGGSLSATGQGETFTGQSNPFGPVSVPAGDYTMTATAPAGYHLVSCDAPGSTSPQTVTVPAGGAGLGRFFVAPDVTPPVVTQTLSGVILVCSSGQLAPGGALSATGPGATIGSANPLGPQMVAAGGYDVTATAPAGFHLVTCNGEGSTGVEHVTVPVGGAGVATFFVAPTTASTPAPDLAIVKTASKASVTAGATLTYLLSVRNVGAGPTAAVVTVTDTVPAGLALVSASGEEWSCGLSGRALGCTYLGASIAPGRTVGAITVVTTVLSTAPARLTNTGVVKTLGDTNPTNDTSTVHTPVIKVLGEKIPKTPTAPSAPGTPATPGVGPSALPFTGTGVTAALPGAIGMLAAGLLLMVAGRRRRRA